MVDLLGALFLAFVGAVVPAFLFRFDGHRWPMVGISGALGWGTYLLAQSWGWGPTAGLFAGACVVAAWSEGVAWILRTPAPAVLVGGVFPLVPGLTAFQALEALLRHHSDLAGQKGGEALAAALAVALGVLTISGLARILPRRKEPLTPKRRPGVVPRKREFFGGFPDRLRARAPSPLRPGRVGTPDPRMGSKPQHSPGNGEEIS